MKDMFIRGGGHEQLRRQMEALRLIYRNKGVTDLTEDELRTLALQQQLRMSILGDMVRILLIIAAIGFLVWRFWPK
jgi:hypothetical protein